MSEAILLGSGGDPSLSLDGYMESFLVSLRAVGYARTTLRKKRLVVAAFIRWMRGEQLAVADLDESTVTAYIDRAPWRSQSQHGLERYALRQFLDHLRAVGRVPPSSAAMELSPAEVLAGRYVGYLRDERGLSENSIKVYSSFVRQFLAARQNEGDPALPSTLDASAVRRFLLDHAQGRSSEYTRLLATALRSFLRFLFFHGEVATDLSTCLPSVRRWQLATVPSFLSSLEVEQILVATDRSSPLGRRAHAMLLLLARLGLRAGEVAGLELDDIRWRTGEIVVRGKGRVRDRLPLLGDVGEALALYIQKDRSPTASRRVFLRACAPRVGLSGPTVALSHGLRLPALACARRAGSAPTCFVTVWPPG